jgi:hypothetical protein
MVNDMVTDFVIPGMSLTREDIFMLVYRDRYSPEEAEAKANALTDNQMFHIIEQFADYFFLDNEGLFRKILHDAVQEVEEYEREVDT